MSSTSMSSWQTGSSRRGTPETLADVQGWGAEARGQVARLVVAAKRGITVSIRAKARPMISSHSLIVDASGYCDLAGHYTGPDIFRLQVGRRARASVHFTD